MNQSVGCMGTHMDKITQRGYEQVVDNIAYHLATMLYENEAEIFAKGKHHPKFGKVIQQLDKIVYTAADLYSVNPEILMDEATIRADEYLSEIFLKQLFS